MMTLGEKIKYLRKTHDLTQVDLAHKLNISKGTMSKYETDSLEPNTTTLAQISSIFNVSADYFIHKEYNTPVCPIRFSDKEIALIELFRSSGNVVVDEQEFDLIKMYRTLSPEEKGEVRGLIRGISIKHKNGGYI